MLCASIILPMTPPELFAAPISTGLSESCSAVTFCNPPNSTLDAVSDTVTATPSQPHIAATPADGTFVNKMRTYTGPSVLVIDDVGITPFDRAQASAFFQVVNRRYENRSATIVTTNRGLPSWGEVFGDPVVAAAILDRLMHRAVVFNIKGPSWRMREHAALAEAVKR